MKLYAITDRCLYPGDDSERCDALLHQAARLAAAGVDYIQLREKDLSAFALKELASGLVEAVHRAAQDPFDRTRILVNAGDPDSSIETLRSMEIDGVHLPASAREAFTKDPSRHAAWPEKAAIVSMACHTLEEVRAAAEAKASIILFAPVFEKPLATNHACPGVGIGALAQACEAAWPAPVFALGGVSPANAAECIAAGAAGVAGIRLFMDDAWLDLVNL